MSEWHTPTDLAATSTSSSVISGTGSSSTLATPWSMYCSAFTRPTSLLFASAGLDQDLDLVTRRVEERLEAGLHDVIHPDLGGDDLLDRVSTGRDQADDPRPVGDRVAPRPGQGDVVLGQHHRLDGGSPGVEAGLGDAARGADRCDRRLERPLVARALDDGVGPDPFGL